MRPAIGLGVALLVVLAGCSVPLADGPTTDTATESPTTTPMTPVEQSEGTGTDGGEQSSGDSEESTDGTDDEQSTGDTDGEQSTGNASEMVETLADPAEDRLGWEAGLWYNETIDVDNSDGMNETERTLAVARAMARVEHVRQLEFPGNDTIPISVISRAEFQERGFGNTSYSDAYRTFDNVKFEALFFVGEDTDSLAEQESNQGASVLGYYSPSNDSIVLISEGDLPTFDGEETLAQEVAHALQDQLFDIAELRRSVETRDGFNGQNGVIEGDGNLIDELYVQECESNWSCIPAPNGSSSSSDIGSDFNWGIYFMEFLPYSDGPGFIEYYYDRGGWDRIDEMYQDPPQSSEQVIFPAKYESDPPENVTLADETAGTWERVRPEPQRPDGVQPHYDTLGMASLSSMFMATNYDDYNSSALVSPFEFLNFDDSGNVDSSDPINYTLTWTDGWEGDRLQIYQNDAGENGYVWRLEWENATDAQQFARNYQQLVSHWGGSQVSEGRWVVTDSSPYADAFDVTVEGETVTIVNAPTVDQLSDVYTPVAS